MATNLSYSQDLIEHEMHLKKIHDSNPYVIAATQKLKYAIATREYANEKLNDVTKAIRDVTIKRMDIPDTISVKSAMVEEDRANMAYRKADAIAIAAESSATLANRDLADNPNTNVSSTSKIDANPSFALPVGANLIPIPTFNLLGYLTIGAGDPAPDSINIKKFCGFTFDISLYGGGKIADKSPLNNSLLFLVPDASIFGVNFCEILSLYNTYSSNETHAINIGLVCNEYYNSRQITAKGNKAGDTTTYNFNPDNLMVKAGIEVALKGSFSLFCDYNIIWENGPFTQIANFYNTSLKRFEYTDYGFRGKFNIPSTSGAKDLQTPSNTTPDIVKIEVGFLANNGNIISLLGKDKNFYTWVKIGYVHSLIN